MRNWARIFLRVIESTPEAILGFTVLVMTSTIFVQVIFRYLLGKSLPWPEQFAVLVFAWMTFIGASVAQKYDDHISINILVGLLPKRIRIGLAVVMNSIVVLIIFLLLFEGIRLFFATVELKFPGMEISRGFLYITIPVTTPLILWYLIKKIIVDIRTLLEFKG